MRNGWYAKFVEKEKNTAGMNHTESQSGDAPKPKISSKSLEIKEVRRSTPDEP